MFLEKSYLVKVLRPEEVMRDLGIKQQFIISESLRFSHYQKGNLNPESQGRTSTDSGGSPFDHSEG